MLKTNGSFPLRRVTTLAPVYISYSIALMGFQLINDFPTRTLKSFPQRYSPSHSELLSCPVFLWELVYPGCKIDVIRLLLANSFKLSKSLNSSPALKHIAWCFNMVSSANLMRECTSLPPPCHWQRHWRVLTGPRKDFQGTALVTSWQITSTTILWVEQASQFFTHLVILPCI